MYIQLECAYDYLYICAYMYIESGSMLLFSSLCLIYQIWMWTNAFAHFDLFWKFAFSNI